MAKQKTKAQREKEQRAALTQRVADIVCAAQGEVVMTAEDGMIWVESVGAIIGALVERFELNKLDPDDTTFGWLKGVPCWVYHPNYLEHYQNVETIVDHLWEHGVRA